MTKSKPIIFLECGYEVYPPQEVIETLAALKREGIDGYICGGALRDTIMGRQISDWDIFVVNAPRPFIDYAPQGMPHPFIGDALEPFVVGMCGRTYDDERYLWDYRLDYNGVYINVISTVASTIEDVVLHFDFNINQVYAKWHEVRGEFVVYTPMLQYPPSKIHQVREYLTDARINHIKSKFPDMEVISDSTT